MFKKLLRWARNGMSAAADWLAVTADVKDGQSGWQSISRSGGGPNDRPWADLSQDFNDALTAWRLNAWVRQVVRLTTAYVIGDGLKVSSKDEEVESFIREFWSHPENRMTERLPGWCDELTRSGELFPVLFTNKIDGMSQVRIIPALSIQEVETDPEDYEKELMYFETMIGASDRKVWKSERTARVFTPRDDGRTRRPEPMMLHYTVNKAVGATRGESDLTPLLPWAQRYTSWLKERVRFNRIRNAMSLMWIKLKDGSQVERKREQYRANPPGDGDILVTGPDETVSFPDATIRGFDAAPDGKNLRLAMATASNQSLVHFGEGDTANLSTSVSMDDRTFRSYRQRREEIASFLVDLLGNAYKRRQAVLGQKVNDDLQMTVEYADISRSDNKELADAAKAIVAALAEMKEVFVLGSAFDDVAVRMVFKFAGELLLEEDIIKILNEPKPKPKLETSALTVLSKNGYK